LSAPALLRRFPELAHRLPWLNLGEWPTPVRELERLGARLGLGALWLKQDDVSGPRCGGNKVRKLELLLAEARERGCRTLVSVGGIGSNHLVATACYGRQVGLPTRGVVFPQPPTPQVAQNLRVLLGLEVELWPCPSRLWVPLTIRRACRSADRPHLIGPGGSSPLGCLGYVSAGLELAEQVRSRELPEPELIVLPLGSGGTCAGLALGLELGGLGSQIWAVRVVERALCNRTLLRLLIGRTARLLERLEIAVSPRAAARRVTVIHDQLGGGYGQVTAAAEEAVGRAAAEGFALETTYSGKAFAALLAASPPRRILFWNTHNSRDLGQFAEAGADRPLSPAVARWVGRG
jgi:D-cysteine desulfhydrase